MLSLTSYSCRLGWKTKVFPHSVRCLLILAKVSMCLQTQPGLGLKKSQPKEKSHLCPHPFCRSGHEQTTCFHHPGNPFSLYAGKLQTCTQIKVCDTRPSTLPWSDRDFLALCESKKPGDVNRRRAGFWRCKDHRSLNTILFKWKDLRQYRRILLLFAHGNHWPDKALEILLYKELRPSIWDLKINVNLIIFIITCEPLPELV